MTSRIETVVKGMTEILHFQWGILPDFNITQDENTLFPACFMEPVRIIDGFPSPGMSSVKKEINIYEIDLIFCTKSALSDDYKTTRKDRMIELFTLTKAFRTALAKDLKAVNGADIRGWETGPVYSDDYKSGYFNILDSNMDGIRLKIVVSMKEDLSECLI